jgi:hypothetical protein
VWLTFHVEANTLFCRAQAAVVVAVAAALVVVAAVPGPM